MAIFDFMDKLIWIGMILLLFCWILPSMLYQLAIYFSMQNDWIAAERLLLAAIFLARIVAWMPFIGASRLVSASQLNLSYYWMRMGKNDEQAVVMLQEAAETIERVAGKNSSDRGRILLNLAGALARLDRQEEAMAAEKEALRIFEQTGENSLSASTLISQSASLVREGHLTEGRKAAQRAVDLLRDAQNPSAKRRDKEHLCLALNNLAMTYLYDSNWDRAIEVYRQSMILKESVFPESDPTHVLAKNNLGNACLKANRLEEAGRYLMSAWQTADGNDFVPEKARCAMKINLGELARRSGDFEKAEAEYAQALALSKSIDELMRAELEAETGRLQAQQGKLKGAQESFESAMNRLESKCSRKHPAMIPMLIDYAQISAALGRNDRAELATKRAKEIIAQHAMEEERFFSSSSLKLAS